MAKRKSPLDPPAPDDGRMLSCGFEKPLLRIDEVATALACSTRHVRNLIDLGEFDIVLVNSALDDASRKYIRIVRESVDEFLTRRQTR